MDYIQYSIIVNMLKTVLSTVYLDVRSCFHYVYSMCLQCTLYNCTVLAIE